MLSKLIINFKRTLNYDFDAQIPNNIDIYLKQVNLFSRFVKFLKRYLVFFFSNQVNHEITRILPCHKSILWINLSAPSIGDSIMDLSSRIMLKDKLVDLFTSQKNAFLYFNDDYFENVFTDILELKNKKYDLVIIDSYSSKSIFKKIKIGRKVNFVGMWGFYNGPEINRTLYSFHKMNHLLNSPYTNEYILTHARTILNVKTDDEFLKKENLFSSYIVIAVGGEWSYRKYSHWREVIHGIFKINNDEKIILVGSNNAISDGDELIEIFGRKIKSYINKLTFLQTSNIIKNSKLLICADGGLMHVGISLGIKTIPLFARFDSRMRLTGANDDYAICDERDVNLIPPESIIKKYLKVKSTF